MASTTAMDYQYHSTSIFSSYMSPAESDGSYFDTYFDTSSPMSTTTVSYHSPKSSMDASLQQPPSPPRPTSFFSWAFGGVDTADLCLNSFPQVPTHGPRDARLPPIPTSCYVNQPDLIHSWLRDTAATVSSNSSSSITGEYDPVRSPLCYIIYHHIRCCGLLEPCLLLFLVACSKLLSPSTTPPLTQTRHHRSITHPNVSILKTSSHLNIRLPKNTKEHHHLVPGTQSLHCSLYS